MNHRRFSNRQNQNNRSSQNNSSQNNQPNQPNPNNPFRSGGGGGQHHDNQNYNRSPQQNHNQPSSSHRSQVQAPPEPIKSGPCTKCNSITVLICSRCGDFYCSPMCQKEDWRKHRYICFKMPELVHSSADLSQVMPSLNGYQNIELTTQQNPPSQHRKWSKNEGSSPTPSVIMQNHQPNQQQQRNSQPQQQQNRRQQQQSQQPQTQQQQQSQQPPPQQQQQQPQRQQQNQSNQRQPRQNKTPPKEQQSKASESSNPPSQPINIGKIDRAPFPKNESQVIVTTFHSSNRCFIRSLEKDENDGYCAVIKKINDYGKNAAPLSCLPQRNAFAITNFNGDSLYYRVQVQAVKNENDIRVIYYDFGNEEVKKLSELKEISKECVELKQYINRVTLKDVQYIPGEAKLDEFLKQYEDVEGKIVYKEKPVAEIYLNDVKDSLNKKISLYIQKLKIDSQVPKAAPSETIEPKQEEPPKPASSETSTTRPRPPKLLKPVMIPPFETIHLPVDGKNLNVVVVDNSHIMFGYFSCMMVSDKDNLQDIQQYLSEYEDKGQPYKPKIEEYCLGKYEDAWYRAKVIDVQKDIYEISFIDFLNESEVTSKDLRRYPMDLVNPCKTSLCLIKDLPNTELGHEASEYLKTKLAAGSEHVINDLRPDETDDVFIVTMNPIYQHLKAEKLI